MIRNRIWLKALISLATLCCLVSASTSAQQKPAQSLTNATKWSSAQAIEPAAGNWSPLLLNSADEFRVSPPPANLDAKTAEELELVRKALRNPAPRQKVAVLRAFFPQDESEYGRMVKEVDNARVWAGVHYRDDMIVGNQVGDRVAAAVLAAIHLDGTPGENPYRSTAKNLSDNSGGPYYNPFYHHK